jgi:hypothetical protein
MDEIFGYFPPVANPPSKMPLLTLLKQARAYGLGIVLATQNPVDLDYKGLANTGTWFIGRLQTERDKNRVIEGLEGAAAAQGAAFDRNTLEQTLAGLGSRVFLMNNVHEDEPVIFETRWALSYLSGPLTRSQIKVLMDPKRSSVGKTAPAAAPRAPAAARGEVSARPSSRPILPPEVAQYFIPARRSASPGNTFLYLPMLYGIGEVHTADPSLGVEISAETQALCAIVNEPVPVDWNTAQACEIVATDLERDPSEPSAGFGEIPSAATKAKSYDAWSKEFANWVYRNHSVDLFKSPSSGVHSNPGESERDFRVRLQQTTREVRDSNVEHLRKKYAPKIAALEDRLRRARQAQEVQAAQASTAKIQTVISFGTTLLGGLFGRKTLSMGSVGRAATSMRGVARTMQESADVARAGETLEAVQQQLQELNAQLESEIAELSSASDPATEALESISIKPKKKDISIKLFGLVWAPHVQEAGKPPEPAW